LTIEGLSSPFCYEGTLNTQLFEFWVENFLLPILTPQSVVILDNASIHKNEEVIAMIEETQASVLFLPPYCPELNPIEPIWAKIKSDLKKYLFQPLMNFIKPLLRLWTPLLPMTLETLFYTVYKISVLYSKEKCYNEENTAFIPDSSI